MKKDCFVGIDTSNYTTSAAVCTLDGEVIANLKRPLPVQTGECGLRQSDAVFAHVKNLPVIMDELSRVISDCNVLAVGVSATPRSVEGSYMPCFLPGGVAARALAVGAGAPLYSVSHQDGHVMAALYSSGATETVVDKRFLAFHVSGGTTEALLAEPTENGFALKQVGGTLDINAGQAIDRVGVMMGLQFPCGREMERLSGEWQREVPKPRICVKDGYCNLSGLQNLAEKLWRESGDPARVSAFVFSFVGRTLAKMTEDLDLQYSALPVIYAGGVMSNRFLQEQLGKRENTYFAEPQFSADNAAGVALICRKRYFGNAEDQ